MGGGPTAELGVLALSVDLQTILERTYERHKRDVYKIALRYGGGRTDWAEDILHDVFVLLAKNLHALDAHEDLMGWLYRTTTHRCLNRLEMERFRALAPLRWFYALVFPEPTRPDAIAFAKEDIERALACIASLPPKERIAFSMFRIDQRPLREIADILGHTEGYVSKLVSRAEKRLLEVAR
jgi:RNA polymerase sigma-70 factor (ECF subfamily)